jgi:8-amino-3,8-dideoxy-alpha-D-manno-octulosonate transaminase
MPGFELIGVEEKNLVNEIFDQSNGVLFAHGFVGLRNGRYRVREFEKAFAQKMGSAHAQAVTSGTTAQYVAMLAMGVRPGDEVITQSFTFVATVETIVAIGAVPVIVDIDDTYNMDPAALEKAITPKTKLIIPVHMLGNPADMERIQVIARHHKIPVLEDACEALGASYRGKPAGTLGDAGVYSLDFAKTITTGEGGMIVSDNPVIHKFCWEFHDHGHENNPKLPKGRDTRTMPGLNLRMTEMQAAVGMAQLQKLDRIVELNRGNKKALKEVLAQSGKIRFRRITDEAGDLADTLIFYFETKQLCDAFLKKYLAAGYITKNVPDAIDWHFAGTWNHMFGGVPAYRDTWRTAWAKSADLLDRSVAVPIFIKKSVEEMRAQGEMMLSILNSL